MFINGSEENGIDTIRTKIKEFASSISLDGNRRYVIIDEADFLSQNAQPALRGMLEEFAANCGFIFTCNHANRIIPALHSRCTTLTFGVSTEEKPKLMLQFLDRIKYILDTEGIKYTESVIAKVIKRWWPDNRRTLNEIQRACVDGVLTLDALGNHSDAQFGALWTALKSKNYKDVRTWIGQNVDVDIPRFYRAVFDWVHEAAIPSVLPTLVVLIADYQYRHLSAGVDSQIHFAALSLEIMNNGQWK